MAPEIRKIQRQRAAQRARRLSPEPMSHVRSVSVGVWIRNGSRREISSGKWPRPLHRAHGFQRHGAPLAEAIAREMDSIGGMLDAFTSKEQICFNAKVLDQNLPIASISSAISVFTRVSIPPTSRTNSRLSSKKSRWIWQSGIPSPRNVYPRFLAGASAWPPHFGHARNCRKVFTRSSAQPFQGMVRADHLLVTAAGNVTHDQVTDLRRKAIRPSQAQRRPRDHVAPGNSAPIRSIANPISSRYIYASVFLRFPSRTIVALSSQCSIIFSAAACLRRLFQNIRKSAASPTPSSVRSHVFRRRYVSRFTPLRKGNHRQVLDLTVAANFARSKNRLSPTKSCCAPKIISRVRLMLSLSPQLFACPILPRQELYFGRFFTLERNSRVH